MKTIQQKVDDSCKVYERLYDNLVQFSKNFHGKTAFECVEAYHQKTGISFLAVDHLFFTACDNGSINLYMKDHRITIGGRP